MDFVRAVYCLSDSSTGDERLFTEYGAGIIFLY